MWRALHHPSPASSAAILSLVLLMLAACASPPPAGTDHYIVTAAATPFFKYGPVQNSGPDFNLLKGQQVTMLKRSYGYSQILTADGQSGWTATDDLAQVPPEPSPTPAKPNSGLHGHARQSNTAQPSPTPIGLPEKSPASSSPDLLSPGFRY